MTTEDFRRIALSFPESVESAHMMHPDFRVGGRIFATLGYPNDGSGVVMLPPEEQERIVRAQPAAFAPVTGGWGRRGSTHVRLESVDETTLQAVMETAWRKRAPKRLVRDF